MSIHNEIAKITGSLGSGGGGGTLGHFAEAPEVEPLVAKRVILGGNSTYTTGATSYVESSSSYRRVFNHGSGQYSVASRHYLSGGASNAQVFVQPFTVNQTTGAITEGSGSALFNGSSNIDTGTFSQIGNYIMTQHTSGSNGNGASACTVSGNSVSGIATYFSNSSYLQPMSNNDAAAFRSGSTMYMYPQVYYTSTGTMHRVSLSYNGSSISGQEGPSAPGSNTSTHYTFPVARQNGQTGPTTSAGLRCWTNSNALTQLDLLNTSGSYDSTVNPQNLGIGMQGSPFEGFGLELSNGRQLYYCDGGSIFARNGGTLTNVTGSADLIPHTFNNFISDITPGGAADTWICASGSSPSSEYIEIVKFSINPTTYKVTILGSVPLFKYIKANHHTSVSHLSLTGSSNQFLVHANLYSGSPGALVHVFNNPFTV